MGRVRAARRAREREARELAELRALAPIARLAIRYIAEIEAPDLREPFSIANRRHELRLAVLGLQDRRRGARPARRAA